MKRNEDEILCKFEPGWGGPNILLEKKVRGYVLSVEIIGGAELAHKNVRVIFRSRELKEVAN